MTKMYGYMAIYKGKRFEVYTNEGIFAAKCKAAAKFKTKTSNIDIYLCEKDGVTLNQHCE